MKFTIHLVHETDQRLLQRLDWLYAQGERLHNALDATQATLRTILSNQESTMATLDEVLADVTAESNQIDSIAVLIQQLHEQVKGVTAGALPPDVQAKVDAIFQQAEANKKKLADAINANGTPGSATPAVPQQDAPPPANEPPALTPTPPPGPTDPANPGTTGL